MADNSAPEKKEVQVSVRGNIELGTNKYVTIENLNLFAHTHINMKDMAVILAKVMDQIKPQKFASVIALFRHHLTGEQEQEALLRQPLR